MPTPVTITIADFRTAVCDDQHVNFADLDANGQRRLNRAINRAYRHVYGYWPWPEALVTEEKAVTNGLLADIGMDDQIYIVACTGDPRPQNAAVRDVPVKSMDNTGIYLDTTLSTVWVQYIPRLTDFTVANTTDTLLKSLEDVTALFTRAHMISAEQEHGQDNYLLKAAEDLLEHQANRFRRQVLQ